MATYNKFRVFTLDLVQGTHNFTNTTGNVFKVMLTNSAPVNTNALYGDLSDLSTAGGYTAGGTVTTMTTSTSSGTAKVVGTDVVFTATAAGIGPFQYAVLYNTTPTSPLKPLIAWWNYGSSISLLEGETFTVDFDGSAGIFTIA